VGAPRMHVWPAEGEGKHPAIVLVYGAAGPTLFTDGTSDHRRYPQTFSASGYIVFMPYYTEERDPVDAVRRAVTAVAAEARVDAAAIALIGYSRGANVALRVAGADARVAAVVEFYGWLASADAVLAERMPPALLLHGAKDRDVRVDEAHKLEALLTASKREVEIHIYPEEGHGFDPPALEDSARRAVLFLDAHLRRARDR